MMRLGGILDEAERPLASIGEVGVAAVHEGAQEIERGSRGAIGLDLSCRIWSARFLGELDSIDAVAAVARQFLAYPLPPRSRSGLGNFSGNAADLDHRERRAIGQHHRHLQEYTQVVADIVGADVVGAGLGKALRAVASLPQEPL